jgi:phosphoglycerol transferase
MQSELFGLKIAQLVLPISGHRLAPLANFKNKYNTSMPLITENDTSSLGVVGSLGFLALLGWPLVRSRLASRPRLQDGLAVLNAAGLLLASIGGLGGLFSLFISRDIRCYNRVSVYLAFFAVLTLALLLERFLHRQLLAGRRRLAGYAILAAILAVGILDQTPVRFAPPQASLKKAFQSDAAFVQAIEAAMPANAMIFQLPNMPFPEAPFAAHEMQDYDLLRGYLHSKTLRWSYGSIKGREGDQWRKAAAALPLEHMVAVVARAGYSGIYVDRLGYADHGSQLLHDLSLVLATRPLFSSDERLVFFSLAEYNRRRR